MSLSTKFISSIDILLSKIRKDLYYDIQDYCFLESATGQYIFTGNDGSLVSIFEIKGISELATQDTQVNIASTLYSILKNSFLNEGHTLQFVYSRDPDRTEETLRNLMSPYIKETKRMQMDSEFLFEDKIKNLKNFTCFEDNFLVLWTRPTALNSLVKKNEEENYYKELGKTSTYNTAQQVMLNYVALENKHKSTLGAIITALKSTNISQKILTVEKASNKIKSSISYKNTSQLWKARLPNSKPVLRDNDHDITIGEEDISYLLYPNLKKQLIPVDLEKVDSNIIKIGNKYASSMYVDIPQSERKIFDNFLDFIDEGTPFQISFKIEGGGLNGMGLRKFLASVLAWSPGSDNKLINESIKLFEDLYKSGDAITKNGISLNTWAEDKKTLAIRKENLFKAIQSWGSQTPLFTNDDPYEGFFNSIPAFFPKIVGNNFLHRMDEMLFTVPLTSQANIWDEGCILNRTASGKIMPYQVAAKKQSSWNELIFAKPGAGKSVWSNHSNFAFCATPKASSLASGKLPFIGILDIGPSSLGLIRLLHSMLPDSRKHEAVYYKLSNSIEDSINVFDLQLGCRFPSDKEKSFLIRFLSLLLTPAGSSSIDSLDTMINTVITALYKNYSDLHQPKVYEKYINKEVDDTLSNLGINAKDRTWWWVVDKIFENKNIAIAKIAQRYAVPKLEDCIKICNTNEEIKTNYSKPLMHKTQETMLDFFMRVISENISLYPVLNNPTNLSFESARVISLDLMDVAPDGDVTAKKQCGVFYMLANFIVTKNFFLDKKTTNNVSELYKRYHQIREREHSATPKRLCIDELHRTSGIRDFREQIKQVMREGRKWSLSVCLISQLLKDFDDDMVDLCNTKFILSGGENHYDIQNKFNLSENVREIVEKYLNGATPIGVPFIAKFSTKSGEYTQFLYSTLSSMERWAFSSTTEDDQIRSMAEVTFGQKRSLQILSEAFPEGTIVSLLEALINSSQGENISNPIEHYMDKLKDRYRNEILF